MPFAFVGSAWGTEFSRSARNPIGQVASELSVAARAARQLGSSQRRLAIVFATPLCPARNAGDVHEGVVEFVAALRREIEPDTCAWAFRTGAPAHHPWPGKGTWLYPGNVLLIRALPA